MMSITKKVVLLALAASSASAFAFSPRATTVGSVAKSLHGVPSSFARTAAPSSASSLALAASGGAVADEAAAPESSLGETLKVGSYFALWYLFNIGYNIYNKQALNAVAFPWTVATIQMATGLLYFLPLWATGLRKAPKLSLSDLKTLLPIALCHTGVHIGAVIALGAGAVSFAHIVKASEPVVTCGANALLLGEVLPLKVYATLLPIIGGVAIASAKELSFTVLALAAAMLSNVSSSLRGVLSKKTMSGKQIGENLDAQNLYAVLTLLSTLILVPTTLAIEGTAFLPAFRAAVAGGAFTNRSLSTLLLLGGATYYLYNEVAFLALGKVNPVTHAVGNTVKRVVIIVASVIAFKTPMSTGSIIGSSIAIAGTLLYSLAMNGAKKEKKE